MTPADASRVRTERRRKKNGGARIIFLGHVHNALCLLMDTNVCAICTESMEDSNVCTLDCDHQFHAKCVGRWFRVRRTDTCPLCRQGGGAMSFLSVIERSKWLRRRALRSDAPEELVHCVRMLRVAEQRLDASKRMFREHCQTHRVVIDDGRLLKKKLRRDRTRLRQAKRRVGVFNDPTYPVPLLLVGNRRP